MTAERHGARDPEVPEDGAVWEMRPCPACGGDHLTETETPELCFKCDRARNPLRGLPNVRIDAAGDNSSEPSRVRDGTAIYNAGLPGVETEIGTRKNGKPALAYRPITNGEVSSNVHRKELAKRSGLEPHERGVYRGLR